MMKNKQKEYPSHITSKYDRFIWNKLGIDIYDRNERIYLATKSYKAFCLLYFPHYFYLKPAKFHNKLIKILENVSDEMLAIIGFRGSAKSTHASMAYPIWQAIKGEHHFIILINDTGTQRDINIENIKVEFEENILLRADFPYIRPKGTKLKWTKGELELSNKVYILGRSRGQKVRGIRYRQWRPSLIVGDDLEDLEWVRKKENRDKTERWLKSEVIPAVEETKAKMIIIGNLLHTDSLMSRLKKHKLMKVLEFPLIDPITKEVTWKAKYPNQEAIDKQKARIEKPSVWLREYLLKIVAEEGSVIEDSDITYYDYKETQSIIYGNAKNGGCGIDLAISEKDTADYTTMVSGIVVKEDGQDIIYVLPSPINKRLDLYRTIITAKEVKDTLPMGSKFFVEGVSYQQAAVKEMKRKGLPAIMMNPIHDKRARFETAAIHIKNGRVRFPKNGIDDLITQMLGFGIEDHDDLVDALVYLIFGLTNKKQGSVGIGKGDAL